MLLNILDGFLVGKGYECFEREIEKIDNASDVRDAPLLDISPGVDRKAAPIGLAP